MAQTANITTYSTALKVNIVAVAADKKISTSETGSVYIVDGGAQRAITLPSSMEAGQEYTFILNNSTGVNIDIDGGAGNMNGLSMNYETTTPGITINGTNAAATRYVRFGVACEDGDRIHVYSTSTKWMARGYSNSQAVDAATSITFHN